MNAFDMISEPILFGEQLREHLDGVRRCVELAPPLADALLAEDEEKIAALHEQIAPTREDVDRVKLSLYEQVKHMRFHSANGSVLNQYLACQDRAIDALQEFADLSLWRRAAIPAELHGAFRALVAQVATVGRRTLSLAEGLSPESRTVWPDSEAPVVLEAVRQVHDENGRARQLERELARRVHDLEKPPTPATILFLDKCGAVLHEMAENAGRAADCLYLMIRHS